MAEWAAAPAPTSALREPARHAWERAWLSDEEIEWQSEPGFVKLSWLP